MDGWMDGMDGRTDGWMDGWMDGLTANISRRHLCVTYIVQTY